MVSTKRSVLPLLAGAFAVAAASLVGAQALAAQPDAGQGPGDHGRILEVHADSSGLIEIFGEHLDFGAEPLSVSLGTLGDISGLCTLIDATEIQCNVGPIPTGDYLLTIASGQGQSQGDEYDLTIRRAVECPCFSAEDVGTLVPPLSCSAGPTLTAISEVGGCGSALVGEIFGSGPSCNFSPSAPGQSICIGTFPQVISDEEAEACQEIIVAQCPN